MLTIGSREAEIRSPGYHDSGREGIRLRLCWCILLVLQSATAWGQESELFEFFQEEARVITASRRPQPLYRAPATVYVVSGKELRASGAQTLWGGLRRVPGVDVIDIRSLYGTVSIRGLGKPLNNRTLVLVDGHSVLDGYVDSPHWETIPVFLEEVERIEVVEGPTSALYGANAINGVINIITKTPDQVQGGHVSLAAGEPGAKEGNFLYGEQRGRVGYKLGLGWRESGRFKETERGASVTKTHGSLGFRLDEERELSFSGGAYRGETDLGLGGLGQGREDGTKWFVQTDYEHRDTRLRVFWNGIRIRLEDVLQRMDPEIDHDAYEASVEQILALGAGHNLVVGASFRRNAVDSPIVTTRQNLWSLYFEDEWPCARLLTLWTSGRLDRHPHSGLVMSPRFSLVFVPADGQVVRLSTGSSFRNPTPLENHIDVVEQIETAGAFPDLEAQVVGNTDLDPELMFFAELAHNAQVGRWQTSAALYHYRLRDVISLEQYLVDITDAGLIRGGATFVNRGETRTWGGEVGVEWTRSPALSGFANYAYQQSSGELDAQISAGGRPRHKINGGVRANHVNWDASISLHWVDRTRWNENRVPYIQTSFVDVDSYTLVNAHLGYCFPGGWDHLEFSLDAANLLDEDHFEVPPQENDSIRGQGGERIGARHTARLTYRF